MKKFVFFISLIWLGFVSTSAQVEGGLVAYYSFDACDATDDTGQMADGVISGNPDCDCGVVNNALILDGQNDFIEFLGSFDVIFTDDFSVSLYFRPDGNATNPVDLISKKESCILDSVFSIRLLSAQNQVQVELSESAGEGTYSNGDLDPNKCWHHIVFVRRLNESLLYYNGIPINSQFSGLQLDINNNGVFSIANSPCLANGEERFGGAIDELRLYNRAITTEEVGLLYFPSDELPITDTIIFNGSGYQARIDRTCANTFSWIPSSGVSDPFIDNPLLSPEISTSYRINLDYGNCTATDTIRITVVDSTEFTCESVFLPNAFSPNGDNINDAFGISNVVFLGDFVSFEIFDRWGGRVFAAVDPFQKWDGTINGEKMPSGMYVYKVRYTCEGEDKSKVGSLSLIR